MKTLTKYISHMKDLHSLNEYLSEKLVINKNFKNTNELDDIINLITDGKRVN